MYDCAQTVLVSACDGTPTDSDGEQTGEHDDGSEPLFADVCRAGNAQCVGAPGARGCGLEPELLQLAFDDRSVLLDGVDDFRWRVRAAAILAELPKGTTGRSDAFELYVSEHAPSCTTVDSLRSELASHAAVRLLALEDDVLWDAVVRSEVRLAAVRARELVAHYGARGVGRGAAVRLMVAQAGAVGRAAGLRYVGATELRRTQLDVYDAMRERGGTADVLAMPFELAPRNLMKRREVELEKGVAYVDVRHITSLAGSLMRRALTTCGDLCTEARALRAERLRRKRCIGGVALSERQHEATRTACAYGSALGQDAPVSEAEAKYRAHVHVPLVEAFAAEVATIRAARRAVHTQRREMRRLERLAEREACVVAGTAPPERLECDTAHEPLDAEEYAAELLRVEQRAAPAAAAVESVTTAGAQRNRVPPCVTAMLARTRAGEPGESHLKYGERKTFLLHAFDSGLAQSEVGALWFDMCRGDAEHTKTTGGVSRAAFLRSSEFGRQVASLHDWRRQRRARSYVSCDYAQTQCETAMCPFYGGHERMLSGLAVVARDRGLDPVAVVGDIAVEVADLEDSGDIARHACTRLLSAACGVEREPVTELRAWHMEYTP